MKKTILTIFFALPVFLQGATFSVTNTNDSGPGSLRQAILDLIASGSAGGNTITINAGVNSILLSSDLPIITKPMAIARAVPGELEIDGNNMYRLIVSNANISLSDIRLIGGLATGGTGGFPGGGGGLGAGGSVYVGVGVNTTLSNSTHQTCTARGGAGGNGVASPSNTDGGGGGGASFGGGTLDGGNSSVGKGGGNNGGGDGISCKNAGVCGGPNGGGGSNQNGNGNPEGGAGGAGTGGGAGGGGRAAGGPEEEEVLAAAEAVREDRQME